MAAARMRCTAPALAPSCGPPRPSPRSEYMNPSSSPSITRATWQSTADFPENEGDSWTFRNGKKIYHGQELVEKKIRNWNPMSKILVGVPGSKKILPPICQNATADAVQFYVKRNTCITLSIFVLLAMVEFFMNQIHPNNMKSKQIYSTTFILFLLTGGDYFFYLRKKDWLAERALFFYWLQTSKSYLKGIMLTSALMTGWGLIQLGLQRFSPDVDLAFNKYGLVYQLFDAGQWWRILSGPYIHNGLLHFISNAGMFVFIGALAYVISPWKSGLVFFFGNIFSAASVLLFARGNQEALCGISGGILAVFMYVCTYMMWHKSDFPKGLGNLLLGICLSSLILACFAMPDASNTAHLAGIVFGLIFFFASTRIESIAGRKTAEMPRT